MKYILALLFFLTLNLSLSCQPPITKKKTSVKKYFYYSSSTPSVDTFIEAFTPKGISKNKSRYKTSVNHLKIIKIDSTSTCQINKNIIHKKVFWSDATVTNIFSESSKQSIKIVTIQNDDTISIRNALFDKNKFRKFDFRVFEKILEKEILFPYELNLKFESKNNIKCGIRDKYGKIDSFKIISLNPKKTYQIEAYNPEKKEWYVKEKVIKRRRKKIIWHTFFHDDHKEYFTTNRILIFNKYIQVIKDVKYDNYGILSEEEEFFYEYY